MTIQRQSLILYSTPACHLCETAHALIAPFLEQLALEIVEVDISESDTLMESYGIRIPVLKFPERAEELDWPFTVEEFLAFAEARP